MSGAFALGVLTEYEPEKLVAVRQASPLIIGVGEGENFIGSDIPAILEYTRNVYILNDGEMAVLTQDAVELMTIEGNFISREMISCRLGCRNRGKRRIRSLHAERNSRAA